MHVFLKMYDTTLLVMVACVMCTTIVFFFVYMYNTTHTIPLSLPFQNIESGISSHTPSVKSLNEAGEKLIISSSAENTAEIQQDLTDLNNQ